MNMRLWMAFLVLAAVAPCAAAETSERYTLEDYDLRIAQDLADICNVDESHVDHAVATAFCHGFFEGAVDYDEAIESTPMYIEIVCSPQGTTRNQAVMAFTDFIEDNPQYASEAPVDAVFRSLSAKWPCTD